MKNIILLLTISFSVAGNAQIITTVAGMSTAGYNGDSILAVHAELQAPIGVAIDDTSNIYIADTYNNLIRKVNRAGIVINLTSDTGHIGYNGDNIPAITATVFRPAGIICDHVGNIYFADSYNNRIRKIDTAGIITTVAGNGDTTYNGDNIPADSAAIYDPHCVALDTAGNLYITDFANHRIRKVNTAGIITTIAGTGVAGYTGDNELAVNAEIDGPYGIVVDDTGNVYFADIFKNIVRKISTSGIITTFAGTGAIAYNGDNIPAGSATLDGPTGLSIDASDNIYIADGYHSRVRIVNAATRIITTVAGSGDPGGFSGDGGPATAAKLNEPASVAIDATGTFYIADFGNDRIRRVGWPLGITYLSAPKSNTIIYPNPVVANLNIQSASTVKQILITDILGQVVYAQSLVGNARSLTVDVAALPSGLYFVRINGNEIKKFIKQ